jgi:hypothetical protein
MRVRVRLVVPPHIERVCARGGMGGIFHALS